MQTVVHVHFGQNHQSVQMVVNMADSLPAPGKSERAVLDAFIEMVQEERYDNIRVSDIVRESEVGRSTFYDHFRDKDDVLLQSMAGIFIMLAGAMDDSTSVERLEGILLHFNENKQLARSLMNSPTMKVVQRGLADAFAKRLTMNLSHPIPLVAMQLADAAWSLVRSWLMNENAIAARQLADAMKKSVQAMLRAYTI